MSKAKKNVSKSPMSLYDARVSNGVYDQLYDFARSQKNVVSLTDALYETDFRRDTDTRGNVFFINNHTNKEYEILLPAEIAAFSCGTKLQASGSHWNGRQGEVCE
jgi:hypothetical protein